jgi:hypothetical protein
VVDLADGIPDPLVGGNGNSAAGRQRNGNGQSGEGDPALGPTTGGEVVGYLCELAGCRGGGYRGGAYFKYCTGFRELRDNRRPRNNVRCRNQCQVTGGYSAARCRGGDSTPCHHGHHQRGNCIRRYRLLACEPLELQQNGAEAAVVVQPCFQQQPVNRRVIAGTVA